MGMSSVSLSLSLSLSLSTHLGVEIQCGCMSWFTLAHEGTALGELYGLQSCLQLRRGPIQAAGS